MTDLLVKLYELPDPPDVDCEIRRALAPERHLVMGWVEEQFTPGWASEAAIAFAGQPINCVLATNDGEILGFACYNTTFLGFFGPVGVSENARGRGIGSALTIRALTALREQGFAYAVIGATKAEKYYQERLNAIPIPDSWPGAYKGLLRDSGSGQ